ncbi:hypothetical protein VNI00_012414 [Paramarasmius palmivorus]|uniref:F-box domain-containing protein n=1 Tax=Paramarasmius palmivorus TaxID=297713 RepID=A0AAW0CA16_9AGAR
MSQADLSVEAPPLTTAAHQSPTPPDDVNLAADRSPTPSNAQIDGDFAIFPAEIIREIVSHAMVNGFTFDSTHHYRRGDNRRTLAVAHVSQRFRQATLTNPGNFCKITLKRPPECFSHSDRQIRFLYFILSLARKRPLNLTLQLLSSQDSPYNIPIPHVRDTLCSCLDNVMEHPIASLTISASQYPIITDFIVTNLAFNKAMFTQPSLTYVEIEVDERIKGWDAMRLLDVLATRRLSCHGVSSRLSSLSSSILARAHTRPPRHDITTTPASIHDPEDPSRTTKVLHSRCARCTLRFNGCSPPANRSDQSQVDVPALGSRHTHHVPTPPPPPGVGPGGGGGPPAVGDALEDFLTVADSYDFALQPSTLSSEDHGNA